MDVWPVGFWQCLELDIVDTGREEKGQPLGLVELAAGETFVDRFNVVERHFCCHVDVGVSLTLSHLGEESGVEVLVQGRLDLDERHFDQLQQLAGKQRWFFSDLPVPLVVR